MMIATGWKCGFAVSMLLGMIGHTAVYGDEPAGTKPVTFTKEVVRILQNRCQSCHRPGQVAPFSLLTYEDARSWADTIKEVVDERRMPPWFADPAVGKFANDRSLTDEEIATISRWVADGMPKGDERDMPEPKKFAEGWQIGEPDLVLTMPEEFKVPATGTMSYRYFQLATDFEEDKWVQAVEIRAGAPSVVHHILMLVRPANQKRTPGGRRDPLSASDEQAFGFFAALAPGNIPAVFPTGFGKRIPKGSEVIFQVHYTPNGTEQLDRSSVGLIFAKEPVHTEIRTRGVFNTFFAIPPGADNHQVKSAYRFQQDAVVLSLMPHMHLRGKSFEYVAESPDGQQVKLLSVPRYDFNWQLSYDLREPLEMPRGSKILCTAHFDNSAANKANPDPTKRVGWGDQTFDEMMIGYINYYVKREPSEPSEPAATGESGE